MTNKYRIVYEFEDLGPDRIAFAISDPPSEKMVATVEDGTTALYVNKPACRVLAEIFARLAEGSHSEGFHVHLHEDFDAVRPEVLRIALTFR